MQKMKLILGSSLLAMGVLLTACNKPNEMPAPTADANTVSEQALNELKTEGPKDFPKTADDQHDLTVLNNYEERFLSVSSEMEAELDQMQKDGNLTPELMKARQLSLTEAAMTMLKDLELKTEQGRYIQGLNYQYWEQQHDLLSQLQDGASTPNSSDTVKGLGKFIQAQEQLEHWKTQYSELAK